MNESRTPRTCCHCLLPIHWGESGLRYFGTGTAHTEARCIALLRQEIAAALARAEKAEAELAAKVVNEQLLDTRSYVAGADVAMDECISNPVWLSNLLSHRTMIVRRLAHALIGAQAELERARKDAQRYRWLRDSMAYVAIQPHYSDLPKSQRTGWTIRLVTGNDNSMDAAIDAAIEQEKKE